MRSLFFAAALAACVGCTDKADKARMNDAGPPPDTGGGKVDYETENKSLFLSRTYGVLPAEQQFKADLDRLLEASLTWGEEVFNRVADRVVPAK